MACGEALWGSRAVTQDEILTQDELASEEVCGDACELQSICGV